MQGMSNERKRKRPSEGSDGPSTKRLDSPAVAANHASAIEPIGEGPSSVRFCMVGDFALLMIARRGRLALNVRFDQAVPIK